MKPSLQRVIRIGAAPVGLLIGLLVYSAPTSWAESRWEPAEVRAQSLPLPSDLECDRQASPGLLLECGGHDHGDQDEEPVDDKGDDKGSDKDDDKGDDKDGYDQGPFHPGPYSPEPSPSDDDWDWDEEPSPSASEPAGDGGGESPQPSASPSPPTLPVTGGSATLAAAAALLIIAGTVLVRLGRRRRA